MTRTGKGHPRRRWIRWAAGVCLALVGLGALGFLAATSQPGWYQPAMVGPEDYPVIRNEIPTFGGAIGSYLEQGQPFRIIVLDDQVNRWIAARAEIWPSLGDVVPRNFADPVVSFQPGRIVLGIRYNGSRISSVLSLAVNLEMDAARGAIHVKVNDLRAGYLPVPRMLVDRQVRKALDREVGRHINALLQRIWTQAAGYVPVDPPPKGLPAGKVPLAAMLGDIWEFRLPARSRWPNGGFAYSISGLRVEQGKLAIDVVPAPRQGERVTDRESRPAGTAKATPDAAGQG
jgi:hypothetical protein